MASSVITTNPFSPPVTYRLLQIGLAVAGALVLGITVGEARWSLLAVIVVMLLVLRWPVETALGIFVLLVPFESRALIADSDSGKTLIWFVGAGAACTLVAAALVRRRFQRPPRAALWWTLFLAWCVLTAAWALNLQWALSEIPTVAASLGLYLVAVSFRVDEKEFQRLIGLTILGGCLAGLYASYEFFGHVSSSHLSSSLAGRGSLILGGTAENSNFFAARLFLPLALTLGAYFSVRSRLLKIVCLGIIATLLLAVLVTMSRGAVLSVLVMAAVFMVRKGVNRRILAVCAVSVVMIMVMPSLFFTRFSEAIATGGAGRLDIWYVGWELFKHYGILGVGLHNFGFAYSEYAGGHSWDSHNIYLQTGVEFGIVGLCLLGKAVHAQLLGRRNQQAKSRSSNIWIVACEAAGWSIMTAGLFGNFLFEKTFWLIWIVFALALQLYGSGSPLNCK
jgi:O-antigen ligase